MKYGSLKEMDSGENGSEPAESTSEPEDDGLMLGQAVYEAAQGDDPEAFAVALQQYVRHCIKEAKGGGVVAIKLGGKD